jgi:hypothetical protein
MPSSGCKLGQQLFLLVINPIFQNCAKKTPEVIFNSEKNSQMHTSLTLPSSFEIAHMEKILQINDISLNPQGAPLSTHFGIHMK